MLRIFVGENSKLREKSISKFKLSPNFQLEIFCQLEIFLSTNFSDENFLLSTKLYSFQIISVADFLNYQFYSSVRKDFLNRKYYSLSIFIGRKLSQTKYSSAVNISPPQTSRTVNFLVRRFLSHKLLSIANFNRKLFLSQQYFSIANFIPSQLFSLTNLIRTPIFLSVKTSSLQTFSTVNFLKLISLSVTNFN